MEARVGEASRVVYGLNASDTWGTGKRTLEWDLNDWKWDGDLFTASSLNPVPHKGTIKQFVLDGTIISPGDISSYSATSSSEEVHVEVERRMDLEKRRRVVRVEDEEAGGSLSLNIGRYGNSTDERNGGTKSKVVAGGSKAICQVEGCSADLSHAKDYHRRHKVCETHSKASKALVGNAFQRFCQQCSRFHLLQEFDEGKRSCRRRLAGHNKRRRKIQLEASGAVNSQKNDDANSLLTNILKLLSNMHADRLDQRNDQELLSHLLKRVENRTNDPGETNACPNESTADDPGVTNAEVAQSNNAENLRDNENRSQKCNDGQPKMNNFDLNDIYIDSDDGTNDAERSPVTGNINNSADWATRNSNQYSSDSASTQSPSNSGSDGQSRTDRIIFKLFGKNPNDIPTIVRKQILDWLSHSPTDIESYIRPGCVVLTVYLRQPESAWEELRCDLTGSLIKLWEVSDDPFWRTGWMYVKVQDQMALAYDGEIIIDAPLTNPRNILSIKPIATPSAKNVQFLIKGNNLTGPSIKLLCALEGNYVHEEKDSTDEYSCENENEAQLLSYSCDLPSVTGRGFIEVEDEGISGSFFPFIVAEEEVCSEIRMLEGAMDLEESDAKGRALEFVHEIGWLLHRSQSKARLGSSNPHTTPFSLKRFKWLVVFSFDREWCAVLKKLLDTLFLDGLDCTGELPNSLSDLCLLHRAVRRNSRKLVEFLIGYVPSTRVRVPNLQPLFRPDAKDLSGLTPLHIAAGKDGSENVLDALTSDPQMVGVDAWEYARDSAGLTPEYYAKLCGHFSYIFLVQRKARKDHVAVNMFRALADDRKACKRPVAGLEIVRPCRVCNEKLSFRTGRGSLVYRPVMLSMIAIAAVCVCAALYFKSFPEVGFVFRPFRWELLQYGAI